MFLIGTSAQKKQFGGLLAVHVTQNGTSVLIFVLVRLFVLFFHAM